MNDGRGKEAARPVRLEDVAREAGVSPITVSRALSDPDKVRPETRERIDAAVKRTGYVVNSIASTLRSGRSSIVTVFVASLRNPHCAEAMQGALDAFEGSRFRLMFQQTGYSDEPDIEAVASVLPFRPAAVMFSGVVRDDGARDALARLNVPVVELWGDEAEPIDMLVASSTREGGRLMAEHFGAQGYSRIAFCGHTVGHARWRVEGFADGLAAFGRELELVLPMEGSRTFADGMAALDQILAELPGCDAIFFGSDILAVGALLAARRRGLDIPGEIAIAGSGDLDFAQHVDPAITSVRVSDYEMGKQAGEMLLARLNGARVAEPVIQVPPRLVVRGSTAGPMAEN